MKVIYECLLLCVAIPLSARAGEQIPTTLSGLTDAIDKALGSARSQETAHLLRVDSLRDRLSAESSPVNVFGLYDAMIKEFDSFDVDSVLYYCDAAIGYARERGDSVNRQRFAMVKTSWLPVLGVVKEAVDGLHDEVAAGIYPANRRTAYEAASRLYFSTASFYPSAELVEKYIVSGCAYLDSLRVMSPRDPALCLLLMAMIQEINDSTTMAEASYAEAIEHPDASPYVMARAATLLAQRLEKNGHDDEALYYFALAAYINIINGDRTGWALEELGNRLYQRGDIKRAYRYLNAALENAVRSGAKVDAMRIAKAIPDVSRDYIAHDNRKINWLVVLSVSLFLALLVIAMSFARVRRDMMQLRDMQRPLAQSAQQKESAISNFLGLCIIYMERLEDFVRVARRKISAGQVDDLYNQLKTGKFLEDQNRVTHEIFDASFTKAFPTFLTDVNALLQPDKQIVPSAPGELTTELRVLAFMRLGVKDTQKVARLLSLSLNTVYTYRNKLRVMALNRETFEDDVMKIGRLDHL